MADMEWHVYVERWLMYDTDGTEGVRNLDEMSDGCQWLEAYDNYDEARRGFDEAVESLGDAEVCCTTHNNVGTIEYRTATLEAVTYDDDGDEEYEELLFEDNLTPTLREAFRRAVRSHEQYLDYQRGDYYTIGAELDMLEPAGQEER